MTDPPPTGDELPTPRRPAGPPAPDTDLDQPGGLLGLLLWPLRAAISLALSVFAAFVAGVLRALLPGRGVDDATAANAPADTATETAPDTATAGTSAAEASAPNATTDDPPPDAPSNGAAPDEPPPPR